MFEWQCMCVCVCEHLWINGYVFIFYIAILFCIYISYDVKSIQMNSPLVIFFFNITFYFCDTWHCMPEKQIALNEILCQLIKLHSFIRHASWSIQVRHNRDHSWHILVSVIWPSMFLLLISISDHLSHFIHMKTDVWMQSFYVIRV